MSTETNNPDRSTILTALVDSTASADLPALAGDLTTALTRALARAASDRSERPGTEIPPDDGALLTVEDAARKLGVRSAWLYRNAKDLPFTRKLGHRTLRFDPKGLERWAKARAGAA